MDGELTHPAPERDQLLALQMLVGEDQHAVLGMERQDRVGLRVGQRLLEVDARHLGAAEDARLLDPDSGLFLNGMDRGRPPSSSSLRPVARRHPSTGRRGLGEAGIARPWPKRDPHRGRPQACHPGLEPGSRATGGALPGLPGPRLKAGVTAE